MTGLHPAEGRQRQREWEQRYLSGQTGWDRGEHSPALVHWLSAGLFPKGRVLVPGCGNGYEVERLAEAGCQVTAVDLASQPVMRLMGRLTELGLHAKVIQSDLLQWTPAEPFDAVYEQTCLCALEPDHWREYEQRLRNWLLPGGTLFALFMQTGRDGGPPFDCPMPDMRALFDTEHWEWPDGEPLEIRHPNGLYELGFVIRRARIASDLTGE